MPNRDHITVTVYGLRSTRDGKIRYVGQTTEDLETRLRRHLWDARKRSAIHKSRWLNSVLDAGYSVEIFAIEENVPWSSAEIRWIAFYRKHGADLVNTTDGGEGVVGYVKTEAQRRAHGKRMKGRESPNKGKKLSAETRAKISAALRKRPPPSAETRTKLSVAGKGKKRSPETIARMKAAQRKVERVFTNEMRAEMSRRGKLSKGRKNSEDAKAHMKAAQQARSRRLETQGESSGRARFKDGDIERMYQLRAIGWSTPAIAQEFGTYPGNINQILHGVRWPHLHKKFKHLIVDVRYQIKADDAREMHVLRQTGQSLKEVAERFGLSISQTSSILSGRHFKTVFDEFYPDGRQDWRETQAKLTADEVRNIHRRYRQGESQGKIAACYGVKQSNIHAIVHGRSWRLIYHEFYPTSSEDT